MRLSIRKFRTQKDEGGRTFWPVEAYELAKSFGYFQLSRASNIVFQHVPEVEKIEYSNGDEGVIRIERKNFNLMPESALTSNQDVIKFLEEYFDLSEYNGLFD